MFVGILPSLQLVLIPVRPSPVSLTNWLVFANTIKSFVKDASLWVLNWLDEKRISPLSDIKCSQEVKKGFLSSTSSWTLTCDFLRKFLRLLSKQVIMSQLFSEIIWSKLFIISFSEMQ